MSFVRNGEMLIKIGAQGEHYGNCEEWDDVCFGKVRQIFVMHGSTLINSIQVAYDHDGVLVLLHRRGSDGDKFDCIMLEPWEVLTGISGHYSPKDDSSGMTVVRSLTVSTNRPATYGPFGREEGTEFSFEIPSDVTFGGFHGRSSGGCLCALGIYV
ncbi:hypothetical protein Taro_027919 [Colocasia esculenta]|uniref:Jacalin-type lectin domain-containing protein n=1 Tax=Colocasia esculenta TaxID=4460 RepID=A0A843V9X6_COLES|nr:hypothetical protein [Colocasia esculenta]